jgi:hypothetical protein
VPLSEHEQRQLEEIEQALYAEHPRFARLARSRDPRVHYRRRMIQAVLGFLIGVGLLVAGLVVRDRWLLLAGAVLMVLALIWAGLSYRHLRGIITGRRPRGKKASHPASSGRLMERLEERWRRRQERGDRF